MSELVKRFRAQAKSLAGMECRCGTYQPVRTTFEPGCIVLHYGPAGTTPVIPEQKHCVHRSIEKALIQAYRKGRARRAA